MPLVLLRSNPFLLLICSPVVRGSLVLVVAGRNAARSTFSTRRDQSRTAIDAKDGLLASRCRMLRFAAPSRADMLVDHATTLRAMAHRCVLTSMVQVIARIVPVELSHHQMTPSLRVFDYRSRLEHCASASHRPSRTASQKRARASARPSPKSRSLFGVKTPSKSRILAVRSQSHRRYRPRD